MSVEHPDLRCTRVHRRRAVCLLGAVALLAGRSALAQGAGQVRELRGEVRVNGAPAGRTAVIRVGDTVATGPDGYFVFVVGRDAFMLRGSSELRLERGAPAGLVEVLRIVTGAVGAVFAPRRTLTVHAPTVTAGIRGTGIYLEARAAGTYFCTCYGAVTLAAAADPAQRELIVAGRHTARTVAPGGQLAPAPFEGHTDAEMDGLERAVGRRSPLVPPR